MEGRLQVLKLFVDELGVPTGLATLASRKNVQKAVYLGQAIGGFDLGYRHGWYLMGPYSTSLTRDYYALDSALQLTTVPQGTTLNTAVKDSLATVRTLMKPPVGVSLVVGDWMELLASWHFLRTVSSYSVTQATETIEREKPPLFGYVKQAETALAGHLR